MDRYPVNLVGEFSPCYTGGILGGRPPIVANIGGMREKVEDGVNGLHFTARNSASLADVLRKAAGNVDLWRELCFGRNPPPTMGEMAGALIELYESIEK